MGGTEMESSGRVFQGNCHCGRYRFELHVPEIKAAPQCECKLCQKHGFIWVAFKVVRDDGRLVEYRSCRVRQKVGICPPLHPDSLRDDDALIPPSFVPSAGPAYPLGEHVDGHLRGNMAVNARTLRGVNPFTLE